MVDTLIPWFDSSSSSLIATINPTFGTFAHSNLTNFSSSCLPVPSSPPVVNSPPYLTSSPTSPITLSIGELYSYNITAADNDTGDSAHIDIQCDNCPPRLFHFDPY